MNRTDRVLELIHLRRLGHQEDYELKLKTAEKLVRDYMAGYIMEKDRKPGQGSFRTDKRGCFEDRITITVSFQWDPYFIADWAGSVPPWDPVFIRTLLKRFVRLVC